MFTRIWQPITIGDGSQHSSFKCAKRSLSLWKNMHIFHVQYFIFDLNIQNNYGRQTAYQQYSTVSK